MDDFNPEEMIELLLEATPAVVEAPSSAPRIELDWLRTAGLRLAMRLHFPNPDQSTPLQHAFFFPDRLLSTSKTMIEREWPELLSPDLEMLRFSVKKIMEETEEVHSLVESDPRVASSEFFGILDRLPDRGIRNLEEMIIVAWFLNSGPVSSQFFGLAFPDPFDHQRAQVGFEVLVKHGYAQRIASYPEQRIAPSALIIEKLGVLFESAAPAAIKPACDPPPKPSKKRFEELRAEVTQKLGREISGQEEMVRLLAQIGARHLAEDTTIRPILFVGATGAGKTHLARSLARAIGVRVSRIDLSRVTAMGYVGQSLDDQYWRLVRRQKGETRWPVLLLDEVDKIVTKETYYRDIRGTEIQNELLTLLEHTEPGWPAPIVILAGAFSSGRGLIEDREKQKKEIGFAPKGEGRRKRAPVNTMMLARRLEEAGLLPELIGRIGHVIPLATPTAAAIRAWLDHASTPLKEGEERFQKAGIKLVITKKGKDRLANAVAELGLGLRGVGIILDHLHADAIAGKREHVRLEECGGIAA